MIVVQEEEISESLKNILYFMKSDGYLVPPSPSEPTTEIWNETWKRVDRFLPGMRKEIFPDPPPPSESKPVEDGDKQKEPQTEKVEATVPKGN